MDKNNMNKIELDPNKDSNELITLIKFLEKTKDGEYAEIDKTSLEYSRFVPVPETIDVEESYYYGIS